jgi:CNP1-like family
VNSALRQACLAASLVLLAGQAGGAPFDDDTSPVDVMMPDPPPGPPNLSKLVEFYVSPTNNRYSIDSSSIVIVEKFGVRFIQVITSQSGVRNVSLEAFRCNRSERKLLAIGRLDDSWAPTRNTDWQPVRERDPARPRQQQLYESMCSGGVPLERVDRMMERLTAPPPKPGP